MKKRIWMILLVALLLAGSGVISAKADTGPKPSIDITVKNAPAYRYITLLEEKGDTSGRNSVLRVDSLEKAAVEEYLESFSFEGWKTFVMINQIQVQSKNEDDSYRFGYRVPSPFRVLLVAADGSIVLSPMLSQKEYNAEAVYDVAAGTLTELRAGKLTKRISYIVVCFLATLAFELIVLWLFRYPFTKKNLICFLVINTITQTGMNIYLANSKAGWKMFGVYLLMEIVIAIVESIVYAIVLENSEGERCPVRSVFYGIVANAVSYGVGSLVTIFAGSWRWL